VPRDDRVCVDEQYVLCCSDGQQRVQALSFAGNIVCPPVLLYNAYGTLLSTVKSLELDTYFCSP
jgi:hypothetical protein